MSEQNFRSTGVKAKSGLCKVKGNYLYIIDTHKSIHKKTKLLAECLSQMPHEEIYVVPAVRDLLNKYQKADLAPAPGSSGST